MVISSYSGRCHSGGGGTGEAVLIGGSQQWLSAFFLRHRGASHKSLNLIDIKYMCARECVGPWEVAHLIVVFHF